METKEQLINNIKEWIKMDTEINELKAEIKERTNKKKSLTEGLVSTMKTNSIDCFDIKKPFRLSREGLHCCIDFPSHSHMGIMTRMTITCTSATRISNCFIFVSI
jgi:uncharacterized membrane protein YqgA involved in biofilm formation